MATEIKLPRLGQGMDEGRILSWLKSEGDTVGKGDEIYEVETEKVNMEVESPAAGTILKIVVEAGTTVPIGTVIAWVGEAGEAVPDAPAAAPKAKEAAKAAPDNGASANGATSAPAAAKNPAPAKQPAAAKSPASKPAASQLTPSAATSATSGGASLRLKASPLARRIAEERGLDLGAVHGSGPDGRVIARDLEGSAAAAAATSAPVASGDGTRAGAVERVELTSMRRTIARRLTEAWQAPAFQLTIDVDMEQANILRKRLVDTMAEGDAKPTVSDVITKACAVALRRHPDMNVHFAGDSILKFASAHIGMAVATDAGLVVPVIRDAHAKSVREIATDRSAIVAKSRSNKLTPDDFEGGTFSISNLGMMGIDAFTAVLNPPMAGILAVGRTKDVVVARNGRPEVRPVMTVTLTCDHRAVDGAVGARFLATVKSNLEEPMTMV